LLDKSPAEFLDLVWRGAFGSWFSLQNTLQRAAPLLLTALCVAIPARLGLVIIGGEAAVALGGLAAVAAGLPILGGPALLVWLVGLVACVGAWVLIARTSLGFAGRVTGGNLRAAQLQGLPVQRLMIGACLLGGGFAGLAGMIEVAAVHGRANASLIAGYGWSG